MKAPAKQAILKFVADATATHKSSFVPTNQVMLERTAAAAGPGLSSI